jgi:hypothetical protein
VAAGDGRRQGLQYPNLLDQSGKVGDVFSVMIDGGVALACRIVGRSRPVRIVMKRGVIRCVYRKLDSAILMVKAAKDRS